MPDLNQDRPRAKTELRPRFRSSLGDYIASVQVTHDGRMCVAGLGDGRVVGIELASGREIFSVLAHPGGVLGVSVSPDARRLATCGQDPTAKLWTLDGSMLCELPGGGNAWVERVAWAPSGDRLATASGRKVRVWTAQGEPAAESDALASTVTDLAWRSDGTALAATCYGGVHILPLTAGQSIRHLAWKGSLICAAWSPNTKVIACGSQDCSVHFWRLATGQDSQMSGYPFKPKALAWDRDSTLLATSGDTKVTVWDFRGTGPEGTRPVQLNAHKGVCTQLAFSPRKGVLATGSQDTSILLWEPRKSDRPKRFAFLDAEVTAIAWHPQHHTLVGTDASGSMCAWEVA